MDSKFLSFNLYIMHLFYQITQIFSKLNCNSFYLKDRQYLLEILKDHRHCKLKVLI